MRAQAPVARKTRRCDSDLVSRLIVSAGRRVGPASKEGATRRAAGGKCRVAKLAPTARRGVNSSALRHPFAQDVPDGSAVRPNYTRAQMLHIPPKSDKATSAENRPKSVWLAERFERAVEEQRPQRGV